MLESTCGAGSNSRLRTSASPRSPASMMAQEWWATSRHSMASACWASRRYRAPSSACRPVKPGRAHSRCRAATRRLPGDRRQRREQMPGFVLARRHPGHAPTGGGGAAGGVPRRAVRRMESACSCGPRLGSRSGTFTDVASRLKTSSGPVIRRWRWPQRPRTWRHNHFHVDGREVSSASNLCLVLAPHSLAAPYTRHADPALIRRSLSRAP
jgi:hypothetical protein